MELCVADRGGFVPTGHPPVEGSRSAGQGPVARRLAVPLREFLDTEVTGGLVLLAATVLALLWANSPWTSLTVVPLFALANAGVPLRRGSLAAAVGSPVTAGVVLGLVVGKLIGISGAAWLAVRLRAGTLPADVTGRQVAAVAGVGFTVSLFIASLAYPDPALQNQARVGILAGSLLAAAVGASLLHGSLPSPARPGGTPKEGAA